MLLTWTFILWTCFSSRELVSFETRTIAIWAISFSASCSKHCYSSRLKWSSSQDEKQTHLSVQDCRYKKYFVLKFPEFSFWKKLYIDTFWNLFYLWISNRFYIRRFSFTLSSIKKKMELISNPFERKSSIQFSPMCESNCDF